MRRAVANAESARLLTAPNPWVGATLVTTDGVVYDGATEPPGSRHAEIVVLDAAGDAARGATVYTTLEPCDHVGRTGPCTTALIESEVARVVVGVEDPDPQVSGSGLESLEVAGIEVVRGVLADVIADQLAPYLAHRRTGRPWVVLKLAATLDGFLAAPDGSSQWITGPEARADAHRLRAQSDAVLVGAGTVRTDDPSLTVRDFTPSDPVDVVLDPLRVVLGTAPDEARVQPVLELDGDLGDVLSSLGDRGVLQLLVEGGAHVAGAFHRAGLVDRYVVYMAPSMLGGDDGRSLFAGPGAATISAMFRGRFVGVRQLGDDLRVEVAPPRPATEAIP